MKPTIDDHWRMIEREKDLPFSFDDAVASAGWMISSNPLPYAWSRDRLEDAQGNQVFLGSRDDEIIKILNLVPGLLLELRRLRDIGGSLEALPR